MTHDDECEPIKDKWDDYAGDVAILLLVLCVGAILVLLGGTR